MDTVKLFWEKHSFSTLNNSIEDCYFYAFTFGKNITYIGQAYHMAVVPEIRQNMRAFGISGIGMSIWLGYIEDCTLKRITKPLINEIESLLIHKHQPAHNVKEKNSYYARANLKIVNTNCPYFLKVIHS